MTDVDINADFSRYFLKRESSEFRINKEDIFYRDKYNEIINYIKVIFTSAESGLINKFVKPKGTLLINVKFGSDVLDFIKLIANNYYLEFFELNYAEISKNPDDFIKNFSSILENIFKDPIDQNIKDKDPKSSKNKTNEGKLGKSLSDSNINKKIILINEQFDIKDLFQNESLLKRFVDFIQINQKIINFIDRNIILVWINYDYKEIIKLSNVFYNIFDLFIKVPILNNLERETILNNFSKKHPNIVFDVNTIIKYTNGWEVNDINRLLKIAVFKHYLNAELNDNSNEISEILIRLIEDGEFVPYEIVNSTITQNSKILNRDKREVIQLHPHIEEHVGESIEEREKFIDEIREINISEFMLNQLYENAASKNYSELILIIDKLQKKEVLEENDRKLLAKYPFILNDSPNLAQINLEKAKKRVDQLKRAFGKLA